MIIYDETFNEDGDLVQKITIEVTLDENGVEVYDVLNTENF